MITSSYSIAFDFPLESSNFTISVIADVEILHSETHYVIRNFRAGPNYDRSVLPDITIKKLDGRWVHIDSEKESRLSITVGNTIDNCQIASEETMR
jgi:hypothetical protein